MILYAAFSHPTAHVQGLKTRAPKLCSFGFASPQYQHASYDVSTLQVYCTTLEHRQLRSHDEESVQDPTAVLHIGLTDGQLSCCP